MILGKQFHTASSHTRILQNHAKSVIIYRKGQVTGLSGYKSAFNKLTAESRLLGINGE